MAMPIHITCGTPAVLKSVLDDGMEPALIAWCPHCNEGIGVNEFQGEVLDVPCALNELLDHLRMEQISQKSERSPS